MHLYHWTPAQVFALTIDDFNFAVKHTARIARSLEKGR
jgi:hypothetical protein